MGSLKRKDAPGGNPPAKSAKSSKEARPAKDTAAKDGKKVDNKADRKAPVVSLLKEDEPAFPRGGGSVLTPLEQKHIQMEAKADAIRDEEFNTAGKPKKKAKKQTTGSKGGKKTIKKDEADSVKAESLNFKKLVKGSLVLGRVTRIHNLSIEVALPNHLTGHVSIVAVSDQLTTRLEKDAAEEKDDDDDHHANDNEAAEDAESQDQNDVDLKSMFRVGQYLRVHVVSTMDTDANAAGKGKAKGKGKRKIELSLRPGEANAGLAKTDIVSNITVMASVVSVEDRGCVMDLGIPGLRGFLSNDEVDPLDQERLQTGAVFLCHVTSATSSAAQLSLKQERLGNVKAVPVDATTVSTFLPGTLVSVLVSNTDRRGLVGKILGHLDATADVVHSGVGPDGTDLGSTYKVGSKIKARVICNFPAGKTPKVGVSLLPHVLSLASKSQLQVKAGAGAGAKKLPTEILPISSIVEKCTVRHVESGIGLYVDTDVAGLRGFVHISRVKEGKVDALYETSGPYKVGSEHRGRILDYSDLDGVFYVSFEKSILEQPYIRLEDVPVGAVVSGQIEKLVVTEEGVVGLVVKLADGISGFVPQRHLSDIRLQNPEKKFKEGMKVKARVLSLNIAKKQMRLTLKKTLVNSEAPIIQSYEEASVGMQVLGSLIKLQENGAHIQFYGSLRGFLPISEMSEAYIRDPSEHFRLGQVVSVHILEADPEARRLIVSCKDPSAFGLEKQTALKNLQLGDVVSAKVTQKTEDEVFLELEGSQLKAILPVGHLTDKSDSKNQHALKRIAAGQTLSDLVVLEKNEKRRSIILSQKSSLVKASRGKTLLKCFEDAKEGAVVQGFVRNITVTAVFVHFAGGVNALLPRSRLPAEAQSKPDFGMRKYESIEVRVASVIHDLRRLVVVPVSENSNSTETASTGKAQAPAPAPAPADDLAFGSVTKARITSVKDTQLNVQIIKSETQGRVDVSQLFDEWDEIADRKKPLAKFHKKQLLNVKVMGVHDAKDHRFLPFSHRSAHSVLELTAKPSDFAAEDQDPKTLSLDSLQVGDTHLAFVNNVSASFLWVNLSPNVRGRISAIEASDDLSQLNDLEANFPVGSALKVRVLAVDSENNRLDLSARSSGASEAITWSTLKKNMVLPGRVTKINERQVLVKFSELVSGPIHLPDFADDYDEVNTAKYKKNEILRVSVVEIDASNKRLRLSLRPSRIMSSTLQVADREIQSASQLSAGDIVRGFVKNVSDKGLFVLLGGQVTALVKISNLSDRFLKEWKDEFRVDQLIKGRVLSVDAATGQIELSLKASQVDSNYKPPLTFGDIQPGQVVTGQIRKVEEFGAFIVIDHSANVSGLCHRTQMADHPVRDATKLYKEGDKVKAMVLDVDAAKKRISFGLKASLFDEEDTDMDSGSDAGALLEDGEDEEGEEDDDDDSEIEILGTDNVEDSDEEEEEGDEEGDEDEDEEEEDDEDTEMADITSKVSGGLGLGKKSAWSADPFDESGAESETEPQAQEGDKKKKPRKKAEAQVDRTAEMDAHAPQTASDYERLLLGQPDSSELWIAYMAFQMQVSELPKAREVAERAIKSISIKAETEKLNVWIAYLNLEVAYGNKQTIEDVFKRACSYNDEQEVYERLGSIYIQSAKHKEAEQLFESMLKKFGAKAPSVWTNYAHFLHVTVNKPTQARSLLARATQQLDKYNAQKIVSRFAALEFRSPNGEPERGRTMFEGLLAAWPKKGDLWNQLLDLEVGLAGAGAGAAAGPDTTAVRDVFERRTRVKGLKPQQAEKWFRRWAAWEEGMDAKGREKVMAKAQDWAAAFKARKEADAEAKDEDEEMEE